MLLESTNIFQEAKCWFLRSISCLHKARLREEDVCDILKELFCCYIGIHVRDAETELFKKAINFLKSRMVMICDCDDDDEIDIDDDDDDDYDWILQSAVFCVFFLVYFRLFVLLG